MNTKMLTLAAALLAASASASADESATLEVTGTITPPPCTIVLGNGGKVDFGTIASEELGAEDPTKLTAKTLSLNVTCPGATKFAISATDQNSSSLVEDAVTVAKSGATKDQAFGLGSEDGQKVGAYVISLTGATADSTSTSMVSRSDASATWSAASLLAPGATRQTGWGSGTDVASVSKAEVTLSVDAAIAALDDLTLSEDITIQGSATIELHLL